MFGEDAPRDATSYLSRRQVLYLGGSLAAGAAALPPPARADDDLTPAPIVDDESLERALPTLSNWGRWGPDDQLGTLNLITTDKRLAAAALIRSGRVVPLGREFAVDTPELRNFAYTMRRYQIALIAAVAQVPREVVLELRHSELTKAFDFLAEMLAPIPKDGAS